MAQKVLAVCGIGMVRSVAMTYALKAKGFDALAMGVRAQGEDTKLMLYQWADIIIAMAKDVMELIPPEYRNAKTVLCDVGPDTYHTPMHPDLQRQVHDCLGRLIGPSQSG